jgi:hypothetical protein
VGEGPVLSRAFLFLGLAIASKTGPAIRNSANFLADFSSATCLALDFFWPGASGAMPLNRIS